ATVLRRFAYALDLGTPTDAVRRALAASGKVDNIIAVDVLADPASVGAGLAVAADEEALPFRDGSIDLVISAFALQYVNDLPGTLIQVRRALKPDGLFLAALAGGDTLAELRERFASSAAAASRLGAAPARRRARYGGDFGGGKGEAVTDIGGQRSDVRCSEGR